MQWWNLENMFVVQTQLYFQRLKKHKIGGIRKLKTFKMLWHNLKFVSKI